MYNFDKNKYCKIWKEIYEIKYSSILVFLDLYIFYFVDIKNIKYSIFTNYSNPLCLF